MRPTKLARLTKYAISSRRNFTDWVEATLITPSGPTLPGSLTATTSIQTILHETLAPGGILLVFKPKEQEIALHNAHHRHVGHGQVAVVFSR